MIGAIAVSSMVLALNATAAPDNNMPTMHQQGEVSDVMGGVGQSEVDAIKHAARFYPLELEFLLKAKPKDEYLAGVKVRIKNA